jgi:hypothetical protein
LINYSHSRILQQLAYFEPNSPKDKATGIKRMHPTKSVQTIPGTPALPKEKIIDSAMADAMPIAPNDCPKVVR